MAVDKAVDSGLLNSRLTELAESIRTKGGTHAFLDFYRGDFKQAVDDLHIGSDLSGVTAQPSDVRSGKKFVTFSGELVGGTKPTQSSREIYFNDGNVIVPAGIYDARASLSTGADPSIIKAGSVIAGVVGAMSAKSHEVNVVTGDGTARMIIQSNHPEWYTTDDDPRSGSGFAVIAAGVYDSTNYDIVLYLSRCFEPMIIGNLYSVIMSSDRAFTDYNRNFVYEDALGNVIFETGAFFVGDYIIIGWGDE